MMSIMHNPGIIISFIIHTLILSIPVSFAVIQKFDEIELFVVTVDQPAAPKQVVKRVEKIQEINKPMPQEQKLIKKKPVEETVKVEELTPVKEKKEIKQVNIQEMTEDIALPPEFASHVEPEVKETSPEPQISSLGREESLLHDVEFGNTTGPKFMHKELPVYPLMARKLGQEGKVVLRLIIDATGSLLNVEVVENAEYGFTEAAIEAVKKSTFLPAKKDGNPIASRALLPIRFTLRRK